MNQMLALMVYFPFAAAVMTWLIGKKDKKIRSWFAVAVSLVETVFGLVLYRMDDGATLSVSFPFPGLNFTADNFRSLYAVIFGIMWTFTSLLSLEYFSEHYKHRNRYYLFLLLTLGAAEGVFLSADFYTAFVFFEILSFTSFVWVIHDETPEADKAAKTYLGIAVIGGLILFMGLALLQNRFGTLNFAKLRILASGLEDKRELYGAGLCILLGFGAKAGMFPLHVWLPKAHPVAPAPASALLSGALTKIGVYGILGVSISLFSGDKFWGGMLFVLAMVTMFLGAFLAVFSTNLKRILACSSMSQIGFILVGIAATCILGEEGSLAAAGTVWHMASHSFLKLTLFMGAGAVYMNLHHLELRDIRGFGRGKPVLAMVFIAGALGLGGIPFFSGYLSKTMLHEAITECFALTGNGWFKVGEYIFMLTGGMTLAYCTKIFVALFLQKPSELVQQEQTVHYASPISRAVLGLSALAIPALGIVPVMRLILRYGLNFAGGTEVPAVKFFSWEALQGALITVVLASVIYFGLIYPFLNKKDEYPAIGTKLPDLENDVYRPVLLRFLPWALGHLAAILDALPRWIFHGITEFFASLLTLLCLLPDALVLGVRAVFLPEKRAVGHPHEGNLFTRTAGKMADRFAGGGDHEHALVRLAGRLRLEAEEVGSGFSFALLLTTMGLVATLLLLIFL